MKQGAEIPKESARFCESGGACAGKCAGGAAESCPEACGRDHLQATAPELAAIIDTLAQLPEADRLAITEHVAALVGMSADRRAAVLMLARPE